MIERTKALLNERQVRRVVVIDDAFDVEPSPEDIEGSRWDRFFDDLGLETGTEDALSQVYGVEAYENADVTSLRQDARFIATAWSVRSSSAAATELFAEFEQLQQRKRSDLHPLESLLDDLGLSYELIGRAAPPQLADAQIIFLDLFLGPDMGGSEGDRSVRRAVERVRAIVANRRSDPPVVILMSASPRVEELGRQLRDDAELLGCEFRIVRKVDLSDKAAIAERIYDLILVYPDAVKLSQFIIAWDEALKSARIRFLRAIRTLDLADYANLHELTVKAEHARMGDYVIDLYDLHLHSIVESDENLVRAAGALNAVGLGNRAPGQFMPSPEVVAMMDGAMFYHEVRTRLGHNDATATVRLGDVLLGPMVATATGAAAGTPKEHRDVYVVISQECDQQHGDVDRILFLQGVAYPYSWRQHGKAKAARPRTPVMFVGQEKFTIEWNLLQPETWRMDEVTRRLTECGYEVVRRFRTPFALALQQAFSGRLNRVGTLATPPARFAAKVCIYVRTRSDEVFLVIEAASTDEHAVCLVGRTEKDLKEWLLLSDKFHGEFRAKLSDIHCGMLPPAVLSARDDPEFYRLLRAGLEFARDDRDGFRPLKDTKHNILQIFTSSRLVAGAQWPQNVKLPVVIEIEAE